MKMIRNLFALVLALCLLMGVAMAEQATATAHKANGIVPQTVIKSVRDVMALNPEEKAEVDYNDRQLTKQQRAELILKLEKQMKDAAKMLEFEVAAALRDQIIQLRGKDK